MNLFLTTDSLIPVLTSAGGLLALAVPGFLFYGYLADMAWFEGRGRVRSEPFGAWDALAATLLSVLFGWIMYVGPGQSSASLPTTGLIALSAVQTEIIFGCILLGIAFVLKLGGFTWWQSLGLRARPVGVVVGRAVLLLLLAYPLIVISLQLWRVLIASAGHLDDSQQDAVRFLAESKSTVAKGIIAVQAVVFAPAQEELIFRGYLYGLARRHLGVGAGLVISSALFAGIHLHLPSFAGLFVLAVCLALAYEWTGSIFVPMAMHALFNLLSVVVLFQ